MKKSMIGYQVYSARDDAAKDLLGTLKSLKAMGYDGVEFAGFYGIDPKTVKEYLDEAGLVAISHHVPFAAMREDIFKEVSAHDIVKYGLIPELVGRLPVIVGLENLDADALVRILSEPKNCLTKQYKKLFEMDGVELEFTESALKAVANRAIERNAGARGLRCILEEAMTGLMFSLPSREDVAKVTITEACINSKADPDIVLK